jgi:Holliday junction resolvasome RuvABC DNA-binding subunit
MTELDWEIINRLDDILAKYRRKIAELREKAGIVDAKEEAIQILGQLGYKATEAKKLVDCCPAGLSANEIIQEVFKRTR